MQYRIGHLTLHPGRQLCDDGQRVTLGRKALEILSFLAEHGGEVVSKDEILDAVWPGLSVEENVIQVHVAAIRRALARSADHLTTVHGIGYQLWVEMRDGDAAESIKTRSEDRPTVAVMRFRYSADPSHDDSFAEAVAEQILLRVARIEGVRVLASSSSFQIDDADRSPAVIARELGATHFLDGSVRRYAKQVRITAQLAKAPEGGVMWSDVFDGRLDDLVALQMLLPKRRASHSRRKCAPRSKHGE